MYWVLNIYENYQLFKVKKSCVLILDKGPSHTFPNTLNFMKEIKFNVIFIPPGYTIIR